MAQVVRGNSLSLGSSRSGKATGVLSMAWMVVLVFPCEAAKPAAGKRADRWNSRQWPLFRDMCLPTQLPRGGLLVYVNCFVLREIRGSIVNPSEGELQVQSYWGDVCRTQ